MHRWLEKRMGEINEDDLSQTHPPLAACYSASIRYTKALGKQAGQPLMRVLSDPVPNEDSRESRTVAGFNLHVSIPLEADDRRCLERLLRYMGRPPLSQERLSKTPDGNIVVRLKRSWSESGPWPWHVIDNPLARGISLETRGPNTAASKEFD